MEVLGLLVTLPPFHERLEELVEGFSLKGAFAKISEAYRQGESSTVLTERADYLAYAAVRMPATYAVLATVFKELVKRYHKPLRTMVDLGSGPGTAYWAAPFLQIIAVERDPHFIRLAQELGARMTWVPSSLENYAFVPVDVALFSYSIAEIPNYLPLVERAFEAAQIVIVVEPGTPQGFERVRRIRQHLIDRGASILAPCPADGPCPSQWCHFSQRLSRSRLHRSAKGGDLGFEDEKYSYVMATKEPGRPCYARIVAPVQAMKGRALLPVCCGCQLETIKLKKTKLKWGEALEYPETEPQKSGEKGDGNE